MVPLDDRSALKAYQRGVKAQLQHGLKALPAPKNDFEIVVPEDDPGLGEDGQQEGGQVEDQADVDARAAAVAAAKREAELKRRSQVRQGSGLFSLAVG